MTRVAILVGSLRKDSVNLKFAKAVAALAPEFHCEFVPLDDLPMYNDDLWSNPPAAVIDFKEKIRNSDAVLFVTAEYNRSIPPVLKNAIDWGSRPKTDNVWSGKPGAVIGSSPGVIGAAVAQSHLRHVAGVVGIAVLPLPEVYFSFKQDTVDANFRFQKQETSDFICEFIKKFGEWIHRLSPR
jgi:chromate reductase, NAD(P)H dehydrogenase (quinone)